MPRETAPGIYIIAGNTDELLPYELYDLGAIAVETRDATTMSDSGVSGMQLIVSGFVFSAERDEAARLIAAKYPEYEISVRDIEDDGWSEGWKTFFKPVVLEYIQIVTPWMQVPESGKKIIVIDPGQAFGTGGHATTKLILEFIERQNKNGGLPERVLDVGSGSGVLSIACAMFGATEVTGIDIDPACTEAMLENARVNHVASSIKAITQVPGKVQGQWPLVLANIQLAVFLECAREIEALVAPGGQLFVSGLLEDQEQQCLALFDALVVRETQRLDEWIAVRFEKVHP